MDGISSSHAGCIRHAAIPIHRRTGVHRPAETAGRRLHQGYIARFAGLCLNDSFTSGRTVESNAAAWLNDAKNSLYLASSVLTFWGLGRALRMRKPGTWLLFWLLAIYPAVYYVVFPSPRYRVPIEPVMTILCVFVITEAGKKVTAAALDRP